MVASESQGLGPTSLMDSWSPQDTTLAEPSVVSHRTTILLGHATSLPVPTPTSASKVPSSAS